MNISSLWFAKNLIYLFYTKVKCQCYRISCCGGRDRQMQM